MNYFNKNKRLYAFLAAFLVTAVLLLSGLFIVTHAEHDCTGENCLVCAEIEACVCTIQLLSKAVGTGAVVIFAYYKTISPALEESAYIDGATFFKTFVYIILPLAKPGLVTIAMLQFINTWNEFYFALMLTSGDRARTIPIALNYYMGTFANNYSALFAAVVMTVLPTIVIFIILQKQVMESLTAGAVKE